VNTFWGRCGCNGTVHVLVTADDEWLCECETCKATWEASVGDLAMIALGLVDGDLAVWHEGK